MALDKAAIEALMAPLRLRYIEKMHPILSELTAIAAGLAVGQGNEEELSRLKYRAHSLSGSGSTYGFKEVSQAAMTLEEELSQNGARDTAKLGGLLDSLIKECVLAVKKHASGA